MGLFCAFSPVLPYIISSVLRTDLIYTAV